MDVLRFSVCANDKYLILIVILNEDSVLFLLNFKYTKAHTVNTIENLGVEKVSRTNV